MPLCAVLGLNGIKRPARPVLTPDEPELIGLWTVYEKWGWGTSDSAQVLALMKRFGSVTVLNGHIHQVLKKVEGKVTFHSAASTAFPQPAPGKATSAGPMKVEPGKLRSLLGVTRVSHVKGKGELAIVDSTLE
jgi:Icc protein